MPEFPQHRTILVVDIAGFTNSTRSLAHQVAMRESLQRMMDECCAEAGIDLAVEGCVISDRGDGMLILLPPQVPKIHLADKLPSRLVAALKRHNEIHSAAAAVQLRLGLHDGEVLVNEVSAVGQAVNFAFRIIESKEAKEALRDSNDVLAVIASDHFYQEVIRADPGADPDRYRKIQVQVKECDSFAWLRLADSGAPEPLLGRDRAYLRKLLTTVKVPGLTTLLRRAGGPTMPMPPSCADAWEAFVYLADFNADEDGLPPALDFLQSLSRQVEGGLRATLEDWIAAQVRLLGLGTVMQERFARSTPIPTSPRLHLLIMIQQDGISEDRCLLSSWRQDDPAEWPPMRGETEEIALPDLEQRVDDLVVGAERTWSGHSHSVALEFLLPRPLFRLPVHKWSKEHASGMPRQLSLDYPVVIRSLERMTTTEWHRPWRARWEAMRKTSPTTAVHFCQASDLNEQTQIDAILAGEQLTFVVLSKAPARDQPSAPDADELMAALRAGIPALFWHPTEPPETLREMITWLLEAEETNDLPARFKSFRVAAQQPLDLPFDIELARDLVILWDDPGRMVIVNPSAV